ADIAAVHELARYAMAGARPPVLDVVPLFESAADLANAPEVLTGMLALPEVAQRVAANGPELEAMLGYSDSAKELGPASATLRLFDTQARLAASAAAHDVRLTLFHGRGGALGRGGGPAGRAVLAQAPGSVNGSFKVTEQGEVIFARYGQQAIAKRHLEQVGSAVLLASSARIAERTAAAAEAYSGVAARIDQAACAAFRRLAAVADAEGPDVLRRAYREWPLFGVLLENAEMSLAKTDRLIGARYLALGGREDLTEMVLAEYDRTRRLVLTVTGHDRLLANRHVLSRAVSLRDPYVDALSYLQLRALTALRDPDPGDNERERLE